MKIGNYGSGNGAKHYCEFHNTKNRDRDSLESNLKGAKWPHEQRLQEILKDGQLQDAKDLNSTFIINNGNCTHKRSLWR